MSVADAELEWSFAEVDRRHLLGQELGTETHCLIAKLDHQLRAHDAFGKARKVLDVGREHQLAARLIGCARRLALDDERLQVCPRRVDRGSETGRTGPDDDHVMVAHASPVSNRLRIIIEPPMTSSPPTTMYEAQIDES